MAGGFGTVASVAAAAAAAAGTVVSVAALVDEGSDEEAEDRTRGRDGDAVVLDSGEEGVLDWSVLLE